MVATTALPAVSAPSVTVAAVNGKHKTQSAPAAARREEVLEDFRTCCISRECSVLARREVMMGRANFGIIGDGKEVAQVAMARAWKKGDFRSGYYRDQTLMFALGISTVEEFFAQLYGDPANDKFSSGRQMNCHFATPFVDGNGHFTDQKNRYNISSDIAPTAGQMARGLGMAFASKKFRENPALCADLSTAGNEVMFLTIGDASTSEGAFWETVNAASVIGCPLAVSVWDDGFGISVPKKYQTAKENISDLLEGFAHEPGRGGMHLYKVKAWDYPALCKVYREGIAQMRDSHVPTLFHVEEVTQQLGHSTSGDHRRYKTPERLQFEEEFDCNRRMAEWMVSSGLATAEEIADIQKAAKTEVAAAARRAYDAYHNQVAALRAEIQPLLENWAVENPGVSQLPNLCSELESLKQPLRVDVLKIARRALLALPGKNSGQLAELVERETKKCEAWYGDNLYSNTGKSPLRVPAIAPVFSDASPLKDGFEVLNACFDHHFSTNPAVFAFGEDVGQIGDVNQGLRGMQQKHGEDRIFDTGIREWTIMGQAIGMAMRGLRPIAEIQYLDYLLYALSPLSDDLCTLRWRSNGMQAAPAIIRTRGHRLVGVWHAGSPLGLMLGSLRGMWICTPRDMTQAAGMYNTLLRGDDPAIVVECLNGYRLKERLPDNIGTFTVPLGTPEVLRTGGDITLVTYGSCVRIAEEACEMLARHEISVELVDVQTLLPFDLPKTCVGSLTKTNRLLVLDEDVPGGASAYILQEILEKQGGYRWLDLPPVTMTAKAHRTAYGNDGDYFSKPQVEDIVETCIKMMRQG